MLTFSYKHKVHMRASECIGQELAIHFKKKKRLLGYSPVDQKTLTVVEGKPSLLKYTTLTRHFELKMFVTVRQCLGINRIAS